MTNIHLRALMRPAQLVWATPGMMMILDDEEEEDNEEEDNNSTLVS